MKDIPIFTATNGMASLTLREIPYRREAYVQVRAVFTRLDFLLRECTAFCRMAGAERVFASGAENFSDYPVHARLMEREISKEILPTVEAKAIPTEDTQWLACYREVFRKVPVARTLEHMEHCYWIEEKGERIGFGQIHEGMLHTVAALQKGAGARCVCALAAVDSTPNIQLLCAMENEPAMKLYDRLGFSHGAIKESWHEITNLAL